MKILILTGKLYPNSGNNANLIKKLIPWLASKHTVCLAAPGEKERSLPNDIDGCRVFWIRDDSKGLSRRFLYPAVGKITDPHGYSDAVQAMVLARGLRQIRKEYAFDVIVSTMEPFPSACAALRLSRGIKKVLYLMDPPNCTSNTATDTPFRRRMLSRVLHGHDLILTTPFIRQALQECGYGRYCDKIVEVGFPMLEQHTRKVTPDEVVMNPAKINLLFCGWLYSDIRSPKYFLDILSRLDERFCVYFMGKECDLLRERFAFETRAQVITLPQQPYQVALNAMADADILINIGNSIPVHMPSKTLEYINTGKPIVNFYKLPDCPTLHYTNRYPLCLNLREGDGDIRKAAESFAEFCVRYKGSYLDTSKLGDQFPECTPQYIAKIIMDEIGACYE